MSWRMKISLYSPKLSRSSQAATSSVPHFWTTKVKSKTPLISTCSMHYKAQVGQRRCETEYSGSASKGKGSRYCLNKTTIPLFPMQVSDYQSTQDLTLQRHSLLRTCAFLFSSISSLKPCKLHSMYKKWISHD